MNAKRQQTEELPLFQTAPGDPEVERFLYLLAHYGRMTRRDFLIVAKWQPRTVRMLAEAAGDQVVRGQFGFELVEFASLDEVKHAAEIAIAQGKKMIAYGTKMLNRAHQKVG